MWISANTKNPFYVRKIIELNNEIKQASVKVCGLGQFEFHINGKKVGNHELDPGWTNYRKWIEFVSFDVTDYLQSGKNCVAAEIGNGWYVLNTDHYSFSFPSFMPPNPNPYKPFHDSLVFFMELKVEYVDGEIDVFESDESYKVCSHYITQSNIYGSETHDHRLLKEGWDRCIFDDSNWKYAQKTNIDALLVEQFQPPIQVIKTYDGKKIRKVDNRMVIDFGQNMSGILSLQAKGNAGDVIKVYPAEKCKENGDIDQVMKGWVTLDTIITFILGKDNEWEEFQQKFTYFAGKVLAIECSNKNIEIQNIKGHAISSATKTDGHFWCDDIRYNQIYDMIEKTVEANMMSVHTDCPTIERFAWQEPNHLMAPSIIFMKDGKRLWKKFLMDMRMEQHTCKDTYKDFEGNIHSMPNGLMPSQCPCYIPNILPVPGMGSFYDIIPWGSTCILGTNWHYEFYNDISIVQENYDAGLSYLNYLKTRLTKDGFINHGLGDWGNPDQELARENIETAFLYLDTITLAKFANLLDKKKDEQELLEFAKVIKDNYNQRLLVSTNNGYEYHSLEHGICTQACEALPLYFGLCPDYAKEDVVNAFKRTLEEKQCFSAGEIGLPYIIQIANQYGMDDIISSFILKEKHPSYYAFIKDGMTTLGEYWEENPRSHCHDMMGHIIEWYYNGIAGIHSLTPGFQKICICPYLPETIHEFTCQYNSVSGLIAIDVKKEEDNIQLQVRISSDIEYKIDTSKLKGNVMVSIEHI